MASSSSFNPYLPGPSFCVVSGASQGIGRALAAEVSKCLGPNSLMLLLARNEKELAVTASLCESDKIKVLYNSVDLSSASEQQLINILKQALIGYQVTDFATSLIFHNVGTLGNLAIETSRMENVDELRQYFDLNVFKVISLNTQFLKLFEEVEDRVIIVNITSLCAIKPMGGMAYYCSGKAAREMYFRVLAEEKKDIRILNYSPGPVRTGIIDYLLDETVNENLREVFTTFKEQGTLLQPETTAQRCISILLSGKYASGKHIDYFDV